MCRRKFEVKLKIRHLILSAVVGISCWTGMPHTAWSEPAPPPLEGTEVAPSPGLSTEPKIEEPFTPQLREQLQRLDLPLGIDGDPSIPDPGEPLPSLSLEQALRRALTYHPELRRAVAQIEGQEFAVLASTSDRYPRINFNNNFSQSGSDGQPGGQQVIRTGVQRAYGFSISLNQQLLDFGRTHFRVRASELSLAATRMQYLRTRHDILNGVVAAYFELLQQAQAVEINRENVRNAARLVEQAQGFLEAGTGAKVDLMRAEADLANADFGLVQAEGAYNRAVAGLATALGEPELSFVAPVPVELPAPEWELETVRELAKTTRPDLLAASLRVAQSEAQVQLARSEYLPILSASAGYNWSDSVFPPNVRSYNVGINFSVPLLNEPGLSAAVGQAEAALEVAQADRDTFELIALQEASDALFNLREAIGSARAAAAAVRAAHEGYRLAFERYQVGVGDSLEVSEARRQLIEAQSRDVQARYGVQTSISALLRATGQLDSAALLPEDLRLDPIFELPDEIFPEP